MYSTGIPIVGQADVPREILETASSELIDRQKQERERLSTVGSKLLSFQKDHARRVEELLGVEWLAEMRESRRVVKERLAQLLRPSEAETIDAHDRLRAYREIAREALLNASLPPKGVTSQVHEMWSGFRDKWIELILEAVREQDPVNAGSLLQVPPQDADDPSWSVFSPPFQGAVSPAYWWDIEGRAKLDELETSAAARTGTVGSRIRIRTKRNPGEENMAAAWCRTAIANLFFQPAPPHPHGDRPIDLLLHFEVLRGLDADVRCRPDLTVRIGEADGSAVFETSRHLYAQVVELRDGGIRRPAQYCQLASVENEYDLWDDEINFWDQNVHSAQISVAGEGDQLWARFRFPVVKSDTWMLIEVGLVNRAFFWSDDYRIDIDADVLLGFRGIQVRPMPVVQSVDGGPLFDP